MPALFRFPFLESRGKTQTGWRQRRAWGCVTNRGAGVELSAFAVLGEREACQWAQEAQERSRFISLCTSAPVPTRGAHAPREMCAKLSSLEFSYASLEKYGQLDPKPQDYDSVGEEPGNLFLQNFLGQCSGMASFGNMYNVPNPHMPVLPYTQDAHRNHPGTITRADAQAPSLEILMSLVSGGPERWDFSKFPPDCDGQPTWEPLA